MISQEEGLRLRRFTKRIFLVQGVRVFHSSSLLHLLFACCWADSFPFPPGLVPGIYESLVKHERKEMPNFLMTCVHSPQQHFGQMPSWKNCSEAKLRRTRQALITLPSLCTILWYVLLQTVPRFVGMALPGPAISVTVGCHHR